MTPSCPPMATLTCCVAVSMPKINMRDYNLAPGHAAWHPLEQPKAGTRIDCLPDVWLRTYVRSSRVAPMDLEALAGLLDTPADTLAQIREALAGLGRGRAMLDAREAVLMTRAAELSRV